jgi:hypothetical protein
LREIEEVGWHDGCVMEINADWAVQAGGWDPRHAVALAVASSGDIAAALIDTNGDRADIDLDQYERDADGHWNEVISGSAGAGGSSWSQLIAATWGQAQPAATIEIEYLGHRHSVVASEAGWWLFVAPATTDSRLVPRQIGNPR